MRRLLVQFVPLLLLAAFACGCGRNQDDTKRAAGKQFELDVLKRPNSLLERARESETPAESPTGSFAELTVVDDYAQSRSSGTFDFGGEVGSVGRMLTAQQNPSGSPGNALDVRLLDIETVDKRYKEHFDRAETLRQNGQFDQALVAYDEAKAIDPRNYAAYVGEAFCYFHEKDFGKALAAINFALGSKPDMMILYAHRGQILAQLGDLNGAIENYSRIIKADPRDAMALAARAQFEMQSGNLLAAVADYSAALKESPSELVWLLNRGWAQFRLRRFKEAAADATLALERQPKLIDAYVLRSIGRLQSGDAAGGKADFDQAVQMGLDERTATILRGNFYPPAAGAAPQ